MKTNLKKPFCIVMKFTTSGTKITGIWCINISPRILLSVDDTDSKKKIFRKKIWYTKNFLPQSENMLLSKIPIVIRLQTSLRKFSQKIIDYNYTVEQFPKIYINSPFSINIQPVDCHNNFNNNELKIKLINNSNSNASVSCHISDNRVTIVGEITNNDDFRNCEELQCFIEAPIQSGFYFIFDYFLLFSISFAILELLII